MTQAHFDACWLDARELADAAARAHSLVSVLAAKLTKPLEVVDLGAGTGANLRYLAPRLGGDQRWTLVDDDRALQASVPARMRASPAWGDAAPSVTDVGGGALLLSGAGMRCEVRCAHLDLARELGALPLPRGGLVCASALLDLVSATWLGDLTQRCREARAAVAFALSFDGRMEWEPQEAEDAELLALFNHHQRTDKGFGPALGPAAASEAIRLFEAAGYDVQSAASDWRLQPSARPLQGWIIDGCATAALEVAPQAGAVVERWRDRRRGHLTAGRSALRLGHIDLIGWLKNTP